MNTNLRDHRVVSVVINSIQDFRIASVTPLRLTAGDGQHSVMRGCSERAHSQLNIRMQKMEDSDWTVRTPVRVLLADDHALVRAGIRALLERINGVEVVAEAGDGREALEIISEMNPDVVLLDIAMPGMSGLEVLRELQRSFPDVRVIVLTVHETEEYAAHALSSGAIGFLPKSAAAAELELALKAVSHGERYVSPQISKGVLPEGGTGERRVIGQLTPRQQEVLAMIAQGNSTKDIARVLNISVKTVETHRAQLMERLGIYDIAGLVRYAIRTGLVRIED
ncbi:MAG: response regulator [Pyrinomonadaceae bacterium]